MAMTNFWLAAAQSVSLAERYFNNSVFFLSIGFAGYVVLIMHWEFLTCTRYCGLPKFEKSLYMLELCLSD